MGATDSSETWPGWNIDDVSVRGVVAPPTIELTVAPASLSWTAAADTSQYDVVRGDLRTLRAGAGDFLSAVDACVADDQGSTSLAFTLDPAEGEGFWFLVRGDSAGALRTYDSFFPSQIGLRDDEIDASVLSCP